MSQIAFALPRPGRLVEIAAWLLIASMVGVVVSQWLGGESRLAAMLQPATPIFLAISPPLAAGAVVTRHWFLGAAALLVAAAVTVMAWPLLRPADEPAARAGADR